MDMKEKMANKLSSAPIDLNAGFNNMFGIPHETESKTNVIEVDVAKIKPFGYNNPEREKLHKFKPYSAEKLSALAEDIKVNGILSPLLVRAKGTHYEILAGHNRKAAAELAGLSTVPCIVKEVNDDYAVMIMATTNLNQREELSPMEKAWGYKYQLEAMNRQGMETTGEYASEKLSELTGDSASIIYRLVRLTFLTEKYQSKVDSGEIPITVARNISFLSLPVQEILYSLQEKENIKLDLALSEKLLKEFKGTSATEKDILRIISKKKVEKKSANTIKIPEDLFEKHFKGLTKIEVGKKMQEILEIYESFKA